jgi:hypothetical protein
MRLPFADIDTKQECRAVMRYHQKDSCSKYGVKYASSSVISFVMVPCIRSIL